MLFELTRGQLGTAPEAVSTDLPEPEGEAEAAAADEVDDDMIARLAALKT